MFVYGTLKQGYSNNYLLQNETFLGAATTANGYILYSLGSYPGMVAAPSGLVHGEVWQVSARCLKQLDLLEDIEHGLYRRERVAIQTEQFAALPIEAYVYNLPVTGAPIGAKWPADS